MKTKRVSKWRFGALLACSGALLPSACTPAEKSRGELMIAIAADMAVPKDLTDVKVEVLDDRGHLQSLTYPILPQNLGKPMPGTLAVVPPNEGGQQVRVRLIAERDPGTGSPPVPRVVREATVNVPTDRIALLPMPLHWLCDGHVKQDSSGSYGSGCADDETCVAGECRAAVSQVTTLEDFTPQKVFGGGDEDGIGGRCLNVQKCFESASSATPDGDCSIELPAGASTNELNVGLVTTARDGFCESGANGRCIVPLDADVDEGWSPSAGRIKLPSMVCQRLLDGTIKDIAVSEACHAKDRSVPVCGPWSNVKTEWQVGSTGDLAAGGAGGESSGSGGAANVGTAGRANGGGEGSAFASGGATAQAGATSSGASSSVGGAASGGGGFNVGGTFSGGGKASATAGATSSANGGAPEASHFHVTVAGNDVTIPCTELDSDFSSAPAGFGALGGQSASTRQSFAVLIPLSSMVLSNPSVMKKYAMADWGAKSYQATNDSRGICNGSSTGASCQMNYQCQSNNCANMVCSGNQSGLCGIGEFMLALEVFDAQGNAYWSCGAGECGLSVDQSTNYGHQVQVTLVTAGQNTSTFRVTGTYRSRVYLVTAGPPTQFTDATGDWSLLVTVPNTNPNAVGSGGASSAGGAQGIGGAPPGGGRGNAGAANLGGASAGGASGVGGLGK